MDNKHDWLIVPFHQRDKWERARDVKRITRMNVVDKKFVEHQTEFAAMTGKELREFMGTDDGGDQ